MNNTLLISLILVTSINAFAQNKKPKIILKETRTAVKDNIPNLNPTALQKSNEKKVFVLPVHEEMKASCNNIRLDQKGGSMENMIETNQELGTCYSHAAIQMYDAWRRSHLNQKVAPSSTASAAYIFKKYTKSDSSLDAGHPKYLLNMLSQTPPCKMKKQLISGTQKTYIDEKEVSFTSFEQKISQLNEKNPNVAVQDSTAFKNSYKEICNGSYNARLIELSRSKNFREVMDIVKNKKSIAALEEAGYFNCAPQDINTSPKYEADVTEKKMGEFDLNFFKTITSHLNKDKKNAMPLALGFCAYPAYAVPEAPKDNCGAHAVTILGQRWNEKAQRCQLLIHDSNMPREFNNMRITHDKPSGQKIWVDAYSLVQYAGDVTYFK